MTRLSVLALLLLAACGVDGPPVPPQGAATPGITFGGTIGAGVAVDGGM